MRATARNDLIHVEVALVGGWSELPPFDEDCARPYTARPKKTLPCRPQVTLQSILDRAAAESELTHPGHYARAGQAIDFYRGSPNETVAATIPMRFSVTLVDENGAARWHVPPSQATLAQSVAAFRAGAFHGDPQRLYLLVDPTAGMAGGTPGGWEAFLAVYMAFVQAKTHWDTLRTLCKLSKATILTMDSLAVRFAAHARAVRAVRTHLEAKGADISDVIALLSTGQLDRLVDVMMLLGIDDPAVAEDLVGIAGFEASDSGELIVLIADDQIREPTCEIPMSLSLDMLGGPSESPEQAHRKVMEGLARLLIGDGLADPID